MLSNKIPVIIATMLSSSLRQRWAKTMMKMGPEYVTTVESAIVKYSRE
jgi:hypothetical protein